MKIENTPLKDSFIVDVRVHTDNRGCFFEMFNKKELNRQIALKKFVQDNLSISRKGTLRGLHFQKKPFQQAKLVTVLKGSVLDVIVDLRKDSPTYKKYFSIILSDLNRKQLFVPRGFAHGFLALENDTIFYYKVDNYYNQKSESGIRFNDETINIKWNYDLNNIIITDKDRNLPFFLDIE